MGILAHNTNVTFNGMATALSFGSIGGLVSNILCGIFQDSITKQQDFYIALAFFLRALRTMIELLISSSILNKIFVSL